jgi:tetratricopeptide (TPR) repeat protein
LIVKTQKANQMKKSIRIKIYKLLLIVLLVITAGCSVDDKLDTKSDIRLTQAKTIEDYQMLLDGIGSYNTILPSYNQLGEFMTDNVYLTDDSYTSLSANKVAQSVYIWDKQLFDASTALVEWNSHYNSVLIANIALDGLKSIPVTESNKSDWNRVQGSALMIRGLTFLNLAEYWAPAYNSSTASSDLGIVLRLSSDVNQKSVRSSTAATYEQIISDLKQAVELLPNTSIGNTQVSKVRPSKAAAYALLARTYLNMHDYANVYLYADNALKLYSSLMDYNEVAAMGGFQNFNKEIVYNAGSANSQTAGFSFYYYIDQSLGHSYDADDLRSQLFFYFDGENYQFVGDYTQYQGFTGVANDEVYLMRAEANARLGKTTDAMNDLNTLLVNRYVSGTFTNRSATDADDALVQILTERRKELVIRGRRWADLKRLNTDPRFAKNLSRTILGQTYLLPANDSRYTLQIPPYIIALNGIEQNK